MAIDATLVVGEANASSSLTTTAQTTTDGRKFALCVSWDAGQTITGGVPSDSKSNTWSALGSQQADGNGGLLRWFITTTALGGSSHTFTVAFSGTAYPTVSVYELTDAGDVDIQTQSQDGGGPPFTMATGALAQAAEVVLAAASNNRDSDGAYSVNASTPTGSLLYSQSTVSSYWTHGVAKYLPSNTSSFSPSLNRSGTSGGTSAISIISIKEAAGGSPPAAPTGVTVGSPTSSGFTVSWTDASSDETGFKIQTSPAPHTVWTDASGSPAAANATSFNVTGAASSTTYKARVASTNANGDSSWVESSGTVTTDAAAPFMVLSALGVEDITETSVRPKVTLTRQG
ncbi:MAG: fibronectin type III domain-containing protein [Gemmatimonadaceae bacterium]|nr:fibronectin type III domain-containing protein [Gemmatimonadaceae bacterium]